MFALLIVGCLPNNPTLTSTQTWIQPPTYTSVSPTFTPSFEPLQTATSMLAATLDPIQARKTIRTLLQEPVDCMAPCFWEITPGKTQFEDTKKIFDHLGLQLRHTNTQNNKDFYGVIFDSDNGLRITPVFTIQNGIVKNINVGINPETSKEGAPREWSAYSPETLIRRYGPPSRVDFGIAWGPGPSSFFEMIMYFDTIDLIVEYGGQDIIPWQQKSSPHFCPLAAQFEIVRLWMGKDPIDPPANAVQLEKATSMTMEEFSKLMTEEPNQACFNLKGDMFPP